METGSQALRCFCPVSNQIVGAPSIGQTDGGKP